MNIKHCIQIKFGEILIETKEIWAKTRQEAMMIAAAYGKAMIEVKLETEDQTLYRELTKAWEELQADQENLSEFLYDDIGDSIEQLGHQKFNELDAKFKSQTVRLSELRDQMMNWEIENA